MSFFKKDKSEGNVSHSVSFENLDLPAQLKKIADHLVFLEKKLDTLLEKSGNRKPYSGGYGNSSFSGNRDPRDNYRTNRYQGRRPQRQGHSSGGGNFPKKFSPQRSAPTTPRSAPTTPQG